ncbi:MAG: 16S rRNA (adenine(1518)-N(6)/adenine(1519)-N(6))-dimethyltransferase RsmA [Deltaproteobacteria bacterium]|nr:16S rRNA (adenine(1518)-N(6)/adenine(1519)-N(6))-dimethyltransferase RsmA [Deltaproteobacteria bacterium]
MSDRPGPGEIPAPRTLLSAHGLAPKKAWGQNFLQDRQVLDRIVSLCHPREGMKVVELGAGLGHLTARLRGRGVEVVAVERDRDLVAILEKLFEGDAGTRIVAADAKTVRLEELCPGVERRDLQVVGNLPYNISTPILFHLLEQQERIGALVVMVQREVAERLGAEPGSKDYGILSIRFGLHFHVEQAFDVAPHAFLPQPKVVSSVVRLEARQRPLAEVGDEAAFARVVKGAFAQRRKTILNSLRSAKLLPPDALREALAEAGIEPGARAETVSIEGFAALTAAVSSRAP